MAYTWALLLLVAVVASMAAADDFYTCLPGVKGIGGRKTLLIVLNVGNFFKLNFVQ